MELHKSDLDPDPFRQFRQWYEQAQQLDIPEPTAMQLATANEYGRPSVRVVLLKHYDDNGLVFFTNYESRKGMELEKNPWAACCFWWGQVARQIRIEGFIEKIAEQESDRYFQKRPRASNIGAIASPQSRVVTNYSVLLKRYDDVDAKFEGRDIGRPPNWGGYLLKPESFEFWQAREYRMHDRLLYRMDPGKNWVIERLAP